MTIDRDDPVAARLEERRAAIESVRRRNRRQIRGRFFMVQSDVLTSYLENDASGRPKVAWPARSIFLEREDAERCAKDLAVQNPGRGFFVLEAVEMFESPASKPERIALRSK